MRVYNSPLVVLTASTLEDYGGGGGRDKYRGGFKLKEEASAHGHFILTVSYEPDFSGFSFLIIVAAL